jgi:hypothetical protein
MQTPPHGFHDPIRCVGSWLFCSVITHINTIRLGVKTFVEINLGYKRRLYAGNVSSLFERISLLLRRGDWV